MLLVIPLDCLSNSYLLALVVWKRRRGILLSELGLLKLESIAMVIFHNDDFLRREHCYWVMYGVNVRSKGEVSLFLVDSPR